MATVSARPPRAPPAPIALPRDRDGCTRIRRLFLASAWIQPPARVAATLQGATVEQWLGAAAIAQRVHQEPLFLDLLKRSGSKAALPTALRADLESQTLYHTFRWEALREATEALLEALDRRGIAPVLLKGIGLAGECFQPAALRPMRDLDVLVPAAGMHDAYEAACECGFRDHPEHTPAKYAGHHHAAPLFHAESGICLEIHHDVAHPTGRPAGFPAAEIFLTGTRPSRVFPGRACVLLPVPAVLAICAHITHGDAIGRRAQNLMDLARTLEVHGADIDWDELRAHASTPSLARSLYVPLGYLAAEGLPSAPEKVLSDLSAAACLGARELRVLHGLIDRYRIGCPGPWPLVSGRISNILWRQAIRDAGVLSRLWEALWQTIRRRHRQPG